jgi:nitrite reductase/ring-hydroxylating ferredoxin subunit
VSSPAGRVSPACARRRALALLGAGLSLPLAGACVPPEPPDRRVRVPLSELTPGRRVRIAWDGEPVEVLRTDSGIVARSLLCTHFGCRLRWSAEESRYLCSCHGGAFDADGRPVAGPPNRPLRGVPTELGEDVVVVGEP